MFKLEKCIETIIELEDGGEFIDESWKKVVLRKNKMMIRQYIEEKELTNKKLRMIHPDGSISDPMKIKLQGNSNGNDNDKTFNKRGELGGSKDKYRVAPDYEPLIIPKHPIGRMRFIVKAIKKAAADEEGEDYYDDDEDED